MTRRGTKEICRLLCGKLHAKLWGQRLVFKLLFLIAFSIPFTSSFSTTGIDADACQVIWHLGLDLLTHLTLTSCWHRSNGIQVEFRVSEAALLWIGHNHVCSLWSAKKKKRHTNPNYWATKHIGRTFLSSDDYAPINVNTVGWGGAGKWRE